MFLQNCTFDSNTKMPKYYGAGIDARLSVCSLAASTDDAFVRREDHGKEVERLDGVLKGGTMLTESTIPYHDDIGRVHYIGPNEEFPIILVKTGKPRNSESPEQTTQLIFRRANQRKTALITPPSSDRRVTDHSMPSAPVPPAKNMISLKPSLARTAQGSAQPQTQSSAMFKHPSSIQALSKRSSRTSMASGAHRQDPQALCLTVELAPQCFNRDAVPGKDNDAKVEVFVNGQYSGHHFIPSRQNSHSSTIKTQFSGYKCDRVLEFPFIVHPGPITNHGSGESVADTDLARHTWDMTNAQLAHHAYLAGTNAQGQRPPTATYLLSLADLDVPQSIETEPLPHGMTYGIVDVIVSLGQGKKAEVSAGYLRQPHASFDEDFRVWADIDTPAQGSKSLSIESNTSLPSHDHGATTVSPSSKPLSLISNEDLRWLDKDSFRAADASTTCLKTTFGNDGKDHAIIPVPSHIWHNTVSTPQIGRSRSRAGSSSVGSADLQGYEGVDNGQFHEWQFSPTERQYDGEAAAGAREPTQHLTPTPESSMNGAVLDIRYNETAADAYSITDHMLDGKPSDCSTSGIHDGNSITASKRRKTQTDDKDKQAHVLPDRSQRAHLDARKNDAPATPVLSDSLSRDATPVGFTRRLPADSTLKGIPKFSPIPRTNPNDSNIFAPGMPGMLTPNSHAIMADLWGNAEPKAKPQKTPVPAAMRASGLRGGATLSSSPLKRSASIMTAQYTSPLSATSSNTPRSEPRSNSIAAPPPSLSDPRCAITAGDRRDCQAWLDAPGQHGDGLLTSKDIHATAWVRQIRAERSGRFKETEVLVAVRFVVPPGSGFA